MRSDQSDIQQAAQIIQTGGLVAMPTETVYGLGANALNPDAVAKIFQSKERPYFDPLIVHISDLKMMDALVELDKVSFNRDHNVLQQQISVLARAFWPGPLTMILPKSDQIPSIVSSGLPTVGIRIPDHPVALELIRQSKLPIAAPSANKFGRTSPTQAHHVRKALNEVDYVLDGGESQVGIESTVMAFTPGGFEILRPGAITADMIIHTMKTAGLSIAEEHNSHEHKVEAPGMLNSHYSPTKPLYLVDRYDIERKVRSFMNVPPSRIGFINFNIQCQSSDRPGHPTEFLEQFGKLISLDQPGNLEEYAVKIFASIHQFEEEGIDIILAQKVPEQGIGIAIMDRLNKAAYPYK